MNQRLYKGMVGVSLAAALTLSSVAPSFADTAASTAQASKQTVVNSTLGKVNIDSVSFFELAEVNLLSDRNGNTISFKVTVHNNSSTDINLLDYWTQVKSKAGSRFTVNLIPEDRLEERVPAQTSKTLTYYADVSKNLSLQDLQFEFVKWDFNLPNFERSLGTISVPTTYKAVTPANQKRNLLVDGTEVSTFIDRVIMSKTEKYHRPTITLQLENIGSQSFTLPAYEYRILTSNGLSYPLTLKGTSEMVLNPKVKDDIQLTGSIPVDVDPSGWKLQIALPLADSNVKLPIATYDLPAINKQEGGAIGTEHSFSNSTGDYHVILNSIHRLPSEDYDLLTADLTITNNGTETLELPKLAGQFTLDQNIDVTATAVLSDNVIGIKPKSSVSVQLYATIPYTYEFTEVRTILQEIEEDEQRVDLLEFIHNEDLSSINTIGVNGKHTLDVIGKRAALSVRNVLTYEGTSANIFSTQFLAENLEKRFSNIANLNAYYETEDGWLYPASVEISENKVAPGGKALVNFYKQFPKNIDTSKLKLVVGEAIIGEDGTPTDLYVNPVAFTLPDETLEVPTELKQLDMFPYEISMSKIRTQINYEAGTMTLSFDYNLTKDLLVEANTENHKLVLEVTDEKHDLKFTEVYSLENGDNPDTTLELGENSGEMVKQSGNLVFQIRTLEKYNLNVYHQFTSGQKKLIGSMEIGWFRTTD
ncbi:hypothetical protein DUZ99_13310 [Xylanibacillus composti]|uniref:Uncharacterized protein n=1 Tax=Xylanibacillus composti TaxID=1572762 RepID=A0A8J4H8W6_9BACL|nr:hypothetical protein [Xylanibacillus composti]MDT9725953.1 hypothetical protein [Xylanibacillus composti]GIQ70893.1 hypothetical protein XYCOK13_37170 [Xylanibacillus composti]